MCDWQFLTEGEEEEGLRLGVQPLAPLGPKNYKWPWKIPQERNWTGQWQWIFLQLLPWCSVLLLPAIRVHGAYLATHTPVSNLNETIASHIRLGWGRHAALLLAALLEWADTVPISPENVTLQTFFNKDFWNNVFWEEIYRIVWGEAVLNSSLGSNLGGFTDGWLSQYKTVQEKTVTSDYFL